MVFDPAAAVADTRTAGQHLRGKLLLALMLLVTPQLWTEVCCWLPCLLHVQHCRCTRSRALPDHSTRARPLIFSYNMLLTPHLLTGSRRDGIACTLATHAHNCVFISWWAAGAGNNCVFVIWSQRRTCTPSTACNPHDSQHEILQSRMKPRNQNIHALPPGRTRKQHGRCACAALCSGRVAWQAPRSTPHRCDPSASPPKTNHGCSMLCSSTTTHAAGWLRPHTSRDNTRHNDERCSSTKHWNCCCRSCGRAWLRLLVCVLLHAPVVAAAPPAATHRLHTRHPCCSPTQLNSETRPSPMLGMRWSLPLGDGADTPAHAVS
ncbi:hypothetical protein COO60DRAFT_519071 [Scenedesmus sp. NREL 46B-D3]|nr:hypothetical protein COO60DRAFT_519071 [Scenedesmus sp. NREL 46B-D3]